MSDQQCKYIKPNGQRCKAKVLPGKKHCVFHAPDMSKNRQEGRSRGGQERCRIIPFATLGADAPDHDLTTLQDVAGFLGKVINRVCKGTLDYRLGNCVGQLCGTLIKALEGSVMEARLADLEQRLSASSNGRHRA
jgi:hypothetical protein